MSDKKVLVEIFNGKNRSAGCSCSGCSSTESCMPPFDVQELTDQMSVELGLVFGEQVEVKYIDTEENLSDFPMIEKVAEMGYPFPITTVNGEPRLAGAVNLEEVTNIVREVLG